MEMPRISRDRRRQRCRSVPCSCLKYYTACFVFLLLASSTPRSQPLAGSSASSSSSDGETTSQLPFHWITFASALSMGRKRKVTADDIDDDQKLRAHNNVHLRTRTSEGKFQKNQDKIHKKNHTNNNKKNKNSTSSSQSQSSQSLNQILIKAGKRGIGGGIPGAVAGVVQVLTLMWLRTIINYQYRYGTTFTGAFKTLFNEGGVPRFYRGLWFALVQAPLSRFVSVAANDGVDALLSSFATTAHWGPGRGTVLASMVVGLLRMALMPVDTCKTILQVDSASGFRNLMRKVRAGNVHLLYQGALAQALSSVIAHYPWFYTYNTLNKMEFVQNLISIPLLRNAAVGFFASIVSDTCSNAIRVVKTTKQAIASKHQVSYTDTISMILAADGWKGLFGRGLRTRIIANGFQSIMFTVIWRGLADRFSGGGGDGDGGGDAGTSSNRKSAGAGDNGNGTVQADPSTASADERSGSPSVADDYLETD